MSNTFTRIKHQSNHLIYLDERSNNRSCTEETDGDIGSTMTFQMNSIEKVN